MTELPDRTTRGLSLLQPWAWIVVELADTEYSKTIENRGGWPSCSYRGDVFIHASKGVGTAAEFHGACDTISKVLLGTPHWDRFRREVVEQVPERRAATGWRWAPRAELRRGGIVGRARIVGVVDNRRCSERWRARIGPPVFAETRELTAAESRWWFGGFALVLADVEARPFTPCKGALGLWTVPEDVALLHRGAP